MYSIPEARQVVRKDIQGLSPAKEVIAEVFTHLLCKRLHYVLSVNWIHTRVFLSVSRIQTTIYMVIFMTVTVVMPMDRWRIMTGAYILSIPSTSMFILVSFYGPVAKNLTTICFKRNNVNFSRNNLRTDHSDTPN